MRYIGRINKSVYRCITEHIVTDEVIITEERIKHIIDRRGQAFYDEYGPYFSEILADPDYIFRDERVNSALVCKSFAARGTMVNIVIRIAVESDNAEYKNSIITAIKENNKRFAQRLRNHEPIYKKLTYENNTDTI